MLRFARGLGILLLLAACDSAQFSPDIQQAFEAKYSSPDGTEVSFAFDPDQPELGPMAWFFIPHGLGPGLGESLGSSIRECGNERYRCVAIANSVFAAPRKSPRAGDKFEIGGAKFTVLSCQQSTGDACLGVYVRSWCEWAVSDETCATSEAKPVGALEGWPTTYLLDSVRGVVWWSTTDACSADPLSAECKNDGVFSLQSEKGLLASKR